MSLRKAVGPSKFFKKNNNKAVVTTYCVQLIVGPLCIKAVVVLMMGPICG